jgi:hypothetical protein
VKDLFRPVLTAGLFVLSYVIFLDVIRRNGVLAHVLSPDEALELIKYIVYSVVFSATTSGVWWFGDRAFSPPGMKNR